MGLLSRDSVMKMDWVEVKSVSLTTDKSSYKVGDTAHATVNVVTGDGTTASGRVMLYGLTTLVHTLTLEPNKSYTVTFTFTIPDVNAGTYTLTAEVDEWVSGPTPV